MKEGQLYKVAVPVAPGSVGYIRLYREADNNHEFDTNEVLTYNEEYVMLLEITETSSVIPLFRFLTQHGICERRVQ